MNSKYISQMDDSIEAIERKLKGLHTLANILYNDFTDEDLKKAVRNFQLSYDKFVTMNEMILDSILEAERLTSQMSEQLEQLSSSEK